MAMNVFPLLSAIVLLPFLGGLAALAFKDSPGGCRSLCLLITALDLLLALFTLPWLAGPGGVLFERFAWIAPFDIHYHLALDGVSFLLVIMTCFLGLLAVVVSWREIQERVASYHFLLLLIQASALGVFLARDLFLFYLFWELQLIPLFFLIGVWGHAQRQHAAMKFFLFSIAGGLLMFLSVIGLYLLHGAQTGLYTFSLDELASRPVAGVTQAWLLAGFLLSFGVKTPIFPLHSWLPDAHTEAPTAGSLVLAGVILKTGTYALLRWAFPLFPQAAAQAAPWLAALGVAALFYAAWIALAQSDLKRLIAYSSIGHMGLIVLGVAVWDSISLEGSVLQMVNHGLTTGGLFIMAGMLAERTGTRRMHELGGLWTKAPAFSGIFLLLGLASAGLPGLNNFVGEILILVGSFRQYPAAAVLGFVALVFTLIYVLRLIQATLFGPSEPDAPFDDLTARESAILVPIVLAVLFLGLVPGPALDLMNAPIEELLSLWME
jgi:NADH-quinone oxidoreductase subunit M